MSAPTLAICVATYLRPRGLAQLLESVARAERPAGWTVEVRVVDNDPAASAAASVEAARASLHPVRLRYVVEPSRNLAQVRNRALDLGPAAFVAFVDDDEQVARAWLPQLLAALEAEAADAAFGPVVRELPADAPSWVRRGGFFASAPPPAPFPWTRARTGNALVRGAWFYERGLRFDAAYGTTGGEDSELFARLQAAGGALCWAPEARVREPVAPNRLRVAWLLQRAYWGGVHLQRLRDHDPRGWVPAPARAAGRALRGLSRCLTGLPALTCGRPEACVRGLQGLALAAGGLRAWAAPERAAQRRAYPTDSDLVPSGGAPCASRS